MKLASDERSGIEVVQPNPVVERIDVHVSLRIARKGVLTAFIGVCEHEPYGSYRPSSPSPG